MAGAGLLSAKAKPVAAFGPVEITDLSHEGRGIAHVEGKAVFIDDALPGETVEWIRTKRTRNFDEATSTVKSNRLSSRATS